MNNNSSYNFELPAGWALVELKDVCQKITDGTHKTPNYIDSGVRFISIKNIKPFKPVDWNSYIKFISREEHEQLIQRCDPEYDDILFPRIGTLGFAKRVDFKEEVSIFVGLGLLKPIRKIVISKYLEYWMNHPLIKKLSHEKATGSGRLTLPLAESRKLPIPVAPINEQTRIVAEIEKQFSRLDEAVENLQRVKANLKRYKASVLKAAVEGKLTEQWRAEHPDVEPASKLLMGHSKTGHQKRCEISDSSIAALPANWCIVKLNKLVEYVTSGSRGWAKYYSESGDLFIRAQNLKNDKLELDDVAYVKLPKKTEGKRTLIRKNDILITITGANVTKTAIVDYELKHKAYVNQHIALTRLMDPEIADYLFLWIICPSYGRKDLERAAYGAGKPGLNLTNIRELIIALPPLAEQRQIVKEVNRFFTTIEKIKTQTDRNLMRAARLRQSLLKKAFSGQLIPQDESDESATTLLENIKKERGVAQKRALNEKKDSRIKRGIKVKSKKVKRNVLSVLSEFPEGITPERLLGESNYSIEEIDVFYMQLKEIAHKIEQIKPLGNKAFKWPHEAEVILRLRRQ